MPLNDAKTYGIKKRIAKIAPAYATLPALQKHIITFSTIKNGKIIFSAQQIIDTLKTVFSHQKVNNTIHTLQFNLFPLIKTNDTNKDSLHNILKKIDMVENKENMSLTRILLSLGIENHFTSATKMGTFIFYNGAGELNQAAFRELRSATTADGYITLTDFFRFINWNMPFEIHDVEKKAWSQLFLFLAHQKNSDENLSVHIEILEFFFLDSLACIAAAHEHNMKRQKEVSEGSCCICM